MNAKRAMRRKTVKLIVGLGNPGVEYSRTYHNIGFLILDHLAKKNRVSGWKHGRAQLFEYFPIHDTIFAKPLGFMNESGRAVGALVGFFHIPASQVLIVHDDSDLPIGTFKLSFGRGAAGHHGVESVIQALQTKSFWRLRIGIRRQRSVGGTLVEREKASELVLQKITAEDQKVFESLFRRVLTALLLLTGTSK